MQIDYSFLSKLVKKWLQGWESFQIKTYGLMVWRAGCFVIVIVKFDSRT